MQRHTFELIGVVVFAASGVLSAGRKGMDLIGIMSIAIVTALGGGTIRDLLLDRHPIFWIGSTDFLTLIYIRFYQPPYRTLLIIDALGLALFTIGGTQVAEQLGHRGIIAVLMGTLTGTAGGIIRDVLCAEVPLLLRPGRLYATVAIAGSTIYLLLGTQGVNPDLAALLSMATVAVLRFAAIVWGLRLPMPRFPPHDESEQTT
jgi:uncharacterized membrane protein YeiH